MKRRPTYLLLFMLLTAGLIKAQIQDPYTVRFSQSLKGNFTTIGNNMVSQSATGNYNGALNNQDYTDNVYVDIDTDPSTFNSSNATLANPINPASCVSIVKAYLYWAAADTETAAGGDNQPAWNFDQVQLMLPGQSSYNIVTADEVIYRGRNTHFQNDPYVCFADITDEVLVLNNAFGSYQVANVEAAVGSLSHSGLGTAAGWQIVFVYQSPDLTPWHVAIYDGYAHVSSTTTDYDITFDGFTARPGGDVEAKVLFGSLDGDRGPNGDRLQIQNPAGTFVDLSAPQRPADNFFNSRITQPGGDFTNRSPASLNTLGFDAGLLDVPNSGNSILESFQTDATFRLHSNNDEYGPYLMGLSIRNLHPQLDPLLLTQTSGSNPVTPGTTVGLNLEVGNTGYDNALSVEISANLMGVTQLVTPIVGLPAGVTYTFDPTSGDLVFEVDDNLLNVNNVPMNIPFELEVSDPCYFLEVNCELSFELQFEATYHGFFNSTSYNTTLSTNTPGSCTPAPLVLLIDQPTPAWSTPAGALDVTVDCSDAAGLAAAQALEPATDPCNLTITKVAGPYVGSGCSGTYTNTFSVTDACGVTIADYVQVITVIDTQQPTASNPPDINLSCLQNIPAPDPTVVTDASDDCTTPTVTFVSDVSDNQSCPETITRTYRVSDDCGNFIDLTQSITIIDDIAPTASNPASVQVSCTADVPAADPGVVTDATDNCGAPMVTLLSESSDNQSCPETITRIYRVSDVCGNSVDVTHTIIILDDINPTASDPAPIQVSCISDVPAPDINVVTDAADNCGVPSISFISEQSDNLNCPETLTRIYRVTDACGNSIDLTQTIIIQDDILPTASNPAPLQVSCIADIPAPDTAVVTDASDNCGVPVVTYVSESSDNQSCPETITRIYRVTDTCGNNIDVSQIIVVQDDILPTASNPAPIQVSCITEVPMPDAAVVSDASDNCGTPVVTFISESSDNQSCPETISRIYEVTDACGNSIQVTQAIIIMDDIAPTATDPDPILVECVEDVPSPDPGVVLNASDNCGTPVVTFVSDTSDNQSCPETIDRIYNVEDACGNFIRVTQQIIIQDITAPTASAPAAITVSCIDDVPVADISIITDADDNCSVPVVSFISESSDTQSCPETITRIYRVTDACGNSIDVSQNIVVLDDILPTASNPAPILVSCITEVPVPDTNVVTDASDNCGTPVVTFISESSDNQSCPETISRIYEVTDACGNSIQVTQAIIIMDDIAPTATDPDPILVECVEDVPSPDPGVVLNASDNCGTPVVTFVSDTSDNQSCPETIDRIYNVEDACGNFIRVTQQIIIQDITAPTASAPAAITVSCIDDVPVTDISIITDADDNCSVPVVSFTSEISDGNTCPLTITRIYTVTDACGNSIDLAHNITIMDDVAPTAEAPASIVLECMGDLPTPDPTTVTNLWDNCGTPTVSFVSDQIQSEGCPLNINRIYRVTDACGNSTEVVQLIQVMDQTAPELISSYDTYLSITCGDAPDVPSLQFTDNCTEQVYVDYMEDLVYLNDNEYELIRTWTAIDDCDNETQAIQTIHMMMNDEYDIVSLVFCDDEPNVDLYGLIENTTELSGSWSGESMAWLDNGSFNPSEAGVGLYNIIYTYEEEGCSWTTEFRIAVNGGCAPDDTPCDINRNDVIISKLVTGNNDGYNDFFEVNYEQSQRTSSSGCIFRVEVQFFNRWGMKVFEDLDYSNKWDGRAPSSSVGSAETLPTGTYYYIVNLVDSGLKPIQGFILLGSE